MKPVQKIIRGIALTVAALNLIVILNGNTLAAVDLIVFGVPALLMNGRNRWPLWTIGGCSILAFIGNPNGISFLVYFSLVVLVAVALLPAGEPETLEEDGEFLSR